MYYAVNTNCLPKVSYMNRVKIFDKTVEFERISSECILVFVDSGSLNLQLHAASAGSCTIAAESGFFLKPDISYSATLEKDVSTAAFILLIFPLQNLTVATNWR